MARAILFDFTQTLADSADALRAAEKRAQDLILRDLADVPQEAFLAEYRALRDELRQATPNFSRRDLWREVYRRHGRPGDLPLLEKWELDYWESVKAATALFPETMPVLERLAGRFALGLVTNKQGPGVWADQTLNRFPELGRVLKATVVAGEAGVPAKPDPAPFRLCLERLGVAAAEAVYVGDDWRVDICGARGAGLRPIWIRHHLVRRNWPDVNDPAPVIDRLDALLDLDGVLARAALVRSPRQA